MYFLRIFCSCCRKKIALGFAQIVTKKLIDISKKKKNNIDLILKSHKYTAAGFFKDHNEISTKKSLGRPRDLLPRGLT